MVSTGYMDGFNGRTGYGFDVEKKTGKVRPTSISGATEVTNEITVYLGIIMTEGNGVTPTTLENTKHEMGHANYVIKNTRAQYEYRKLKQFGPKYDGHATDDKSGEKAREWQFDKDK